jgi:hypothetical protein
MRSQTCGCMPTLHPMSRTVVAKMKLLAKVKIDRLLVSLEARAKRDDLGFGENDLHYSAMLM